jgi:hypothetical protein
MITSMSMSRSAEYGATRRENADFGLRIAERRVKRTAGKQGIPEIFLFLRIPIS